ncbi:MAG TPA: hypothetical protein VI299_07230 [Polyangiales bacterium]
MPSRAESSASLVAMRARFEHSYVQHARFREDAALVEALAREAEPVLEVLATGYQTGAMHEGYALFNLLSRHAASLGATPGVALSLVESIGEAMSEVGIALPPERKNELLLIAFEGYCAARDERATRLLREMAAERQVATELAPGCVAIFLAGSHDEADLGPTLERFARDLLRGDARSCLLDLTRLVLPIDEDVARALGRFCAQAATLGVCSFVVGAPASLRAQFERWSVSGGPILLVDDPAQARSLALTAAGHELRPVRRWPRWFLPARRSLVR